MSTLSYLAKSSINTENNSALDVTGSLGINLWVLLKTMSKNMILLCTVVTIVNVVNCSSLEPRDVCYMTSIPGRDCNLSACRAGGGYCSFSNSNCTGKNMRGANAPIECKTNCMCTRDRDADGTGPQFIEQVPEVWNAGYMLGTGRVESYDLPEKMNDAIGDYKQEVLDHRTWTDDNNVQAISSSATITYNVFDGFESHQLELSYSQWHPYDYVSWYDLATAITVVQSAMNVDYGLLADHAAIAIGGVGNQLTKGFFTLTWKCGQNLIPLRRDTSLSETKSLGNVSKVSYSGLVQNPRREHSEAYQSNIIVPPRVVDHRLG